MDADEVIREIRKHLESIGPNTNLVIGPATAATLLTEIAGLRAENARLHEETNKFASHILALNSTIEGIARWIDDGGKSMTGFADDLRLALNGKFVNLGPPNGGPGGPGKGGNRGDL